MANDDLTVSQLLNVIEKVHKAMGWVLTTQGKFDEPEGTTKEKDEALEELKRFHAQLWEYR